MMHMVDLNDSVPFIHMIGGQEFVVMSNKRYKELYMAEIERNTLKDVIDKLPVQTSQT